MDYVQIVTAEDWGLVAIVPPSQSKVAPPPVKAPTYVRPQIPKLSHQEPLARSGEAIIVNRSSGREILAPLPADLLTPAPEPQSKEGRRPILTDGNLLYVPGADVGLPNIMTHKNKDHILMGFGR